MQNIVLRNTTRIRFGKAGAHPQLALGIAIAPETLYFTTTFFIWRQLRFFRFTLRFLLHWLCQFDLLRKCGLLAHTSPAFLKNCWIKKLFICLWLVTYSLISSKKECFAWLALTVVHSSNQNPSIVTTADNNCQRCIPKNPLHRNIRFDFGWYHWFYCPSY